MSPNGAQKKTPRASSGACSSTSPGVSAARLHGWLRGGKKLPPGVEYRLALRDRALALWGPPPVWRGKELRRLAAMAAVASVRKIRITGGEPLVRRGLVGFLQDLNRITGIDQVCLTTNGVLLRKSGPASFNVRGCPLKVRGDF